MAGRADPVRVAMIQIEIRVIECRSRPCAGGVARGASRREASGRMVRVRRPVVVNLMAAHARRWQCRVVIVHVALRARHIGGVVASQRERRGVVIESRSGPVGEVVAGIARRRETHGGMRRRVRTVIVRLVTGNARSGIRQIVRPARTKRGVVALRAL
jgi:hypothetical protein